MQANVATTRMFYTISPATRSDPRYNDVVLPLFVSQALRAALEAESVPMHYAPSGEADGLCVSLARKLDGYVLGQDTDFIIFNGQYAPLDMMEWISAPVSEPQADVDEFQTVSKTKMKKQRQSSLLPSSDGDQLVLATFSSEMLAKRLRLPVTMLPLLASLVGNDYSPKWASDLFFTGVRAAERVERVARVLRELNLKPRSGPEAAVDLVQRAVKQLSSRHLDEKSLNDVVDRLIDATMQYVLPESDCCEAYPFCKECTTQSPAAKAYSKALKAGHANRVTHAYLHPDRVYLHGGLEDPAVPSVHASEAAVAARRAAYAIIDNEVGVLWPPSPEKEEELKQDAEASVLLSDEANESEAIAILGVAESEGATEPVSESEVEPPVLRTVIEYGRHGGSISSRGIELPDPEEEYQSITQQPLSTRLSTYLSILGSEGASSLPVHIQPLVAALRLAVRAGGWRRVEVEAVLRGGIGSVEAWREGTPIESADLPLLTSTNAQRVAQLTSALMDTQLVAQALLLDSDELTHLTPHVFIAGTALHYLLSGVDPPRGVWAWSAEWSDVYKAALAAVLDGLEVEEGRRKKTKAKGDKVTKSTSNPVGRFDLLALESA